MRASAAPSRYSRSLTSKPPLSKVRPISAIGYLTLCYCVERQMRTSWSTRSIPCCPPVLFPSTSTLRSQRAVGQSNTTSFPVASKRLAESGWRDD